MTVVQDFTVVCMAILVLAALSGAIVKSGGADAPRATIAMVLMAGGGSIGALLQYGTME